MRKIEFLECFLQTIVRVFTTSGNMTMIIKKKSWLTSYDSIEKLTNTEKNISTGTLSQMHTQPHKDM